MTTAKAWLALGSNLGDRKAHLAFAKAQLTTMAGVSHIVASPIEETLPLGGADQPPYLNQMLRVTTHLTPIDLLQQCHAVERAAGRDRTTRWASRTLDIDLVRYDSWMCDLPTLVLPHPGLRDRPFWAREMAALESHD